MKKPGRACVYRQFCSSMKNRVVPVGKYHVEVSIEGLRCNCPSYRFSKPPDKTCKHVKGIDLCGWDEDWDNEVQTGEQAINHICPRCGGETVTMRVMV